MDDTLDDIFRQHYGPLVRWLRYRLGDADTAEDVAQEVFLGAWRHQPHTPRAWLYAAAANRTRDIARQAKRAARRRELMVWEVEATTPNWDPMADDTQDQEAVMWRALAAMRPRDREALLLWDAAVPYSQMAAHLGVAPESVGTTLQRAKGKLMAAVAQQQHSPGGQ